MMPCSKFLFLATIFPKNVGGGGGGGGRGGRKNFSRHKQVKLRVKKFSGPISVKYRSINSTQFPLKALQVT